MTKIRYYIGIGDDERTGEYVAFMESFPDRKRNVVRGTKFSPVLAEMVKRLRKKERNVKRFPLPAEEKYIIVPPQSSIVPPSLIVPRSNGH